MDEGADSWGHALFAWQGQVEVGCVELRALFDGEAHLREFLPGNMWEPAHDCRFWLLVSIVDDLEALAGDFCFEVFASDHQYFCAGAHAVGEHAGGDDSRGDNLLGFAFHAETGNLVGDSLWEARGVVGRVGDEHALLSGGGERLGGIFHWLRPTVHNAIQVEKA